MGSVLLTIVAFFLLRFLWDYYQQNLAVARQGGMAFKYQELIQLLRMGYATVTVKQVTSNSITYSGRGDAGTLSLRSPRPSAK